MHALEANPLPIWCTSAPHDEYSSSTVSSSSCLSPVKKDTISQNLRATRILAVDRRSHVGDANLVGVAVRNVPPLVWSSDIRRD